MKLSEFARHAFNEAVQLGDAQPEDEAGFMRGVRVGFFLFQRKEQQRHRRDVAVIGDDCTAQIRRDPFLSLLSVTDEHVEVD